MANQENQSIKVRASAKRREDHHYPHLTGYEIRYFYEVFPSLSEVDLCVMMGLTAFAFGGTETTPTRGALATFVQGATLDSRKKKVSRSLKRMQEAGALEVFEQDGKASIYDITLFNARTFDFAKSQGWFDSIKFNPSMDTSVHTPSPDLSTLKTEQEEATNKKILPVTSTGVTPETSESHASTDETQPDDTDTWLMDLLATEDDLAKRLKIAQDITFPPRPTETHSNGKFTAGLTKTEWFIRLEQIIKAFTTAAGYKIRETSNWLVKETDYDIPDLLAMWGYIQNTHAFNSLPYAVKGKGKGIQWAFSEWQQSQPAPPPPPPVVPVVSTAEKARILADIKARKNGQLPVEDFSFGESS